MILGHTPCRANLDNQDILAIILLSPHPPEVAMAGQTEWIAVHLLCVVSLLGSFSFGAPPREAFPAASSSDRDAPGGLASSR